MSLLVIILFLRHTRSIESFPSSSENEKFRLSSSPLTRVKDVRLDPGTGIARWEDILAVNLNNGSSSPCQHYKDTG